MKNDNISLDVCYEIHCTESKMSEDKLITWGKRATGRSSSYEKHKKEYKDKVWGENAREKCYPEIGIYRKWLVFSNIYEFDFFRDWM